MLLDTPKSYFEYRNRSISKVYAFFKTMPQGNAILKPTCLNFGTLNGWKRSSKGFPRVSWRPSIFDHFFVLQDVSWAANLAARRCSNSPRRRPGGSQERGGDGSKIDPRAKTRPRRVRHPEKVLSDPLPGTIFPSFWGSILDILHSAPMHFVESCLVTVNMWIRYSKTHSIQVCKKSALSLLAPVHATWQLKLD